MADAESEVPIVAGRSCAGCTLCCKIMAIVELKKPRQTWCQHCAVGQGCRIYAERPFECRDFYCGWLLNPNLGEHWKPLRSHMVLTWHPKDTQIQVQVDAGRLDAWRKQPYHSDIHRWAEAAAEHGGHVVVRQGADIVIVLPGGVEKNLGPIPDGKVVITNKPAGPGAKWDAIAVDPDDPRAKAAGS